MGSINSSSFIGHLVIKPGVMKATMVKCKNFSHSHIYNEVVTMYNHLRASYHWPDHRKLRYSSSVGRHFF